MENVDYMERLVSMKASIENMMSQYNSYDERKHKLEKIRSILIDKSSPYVMRTSMLTAQEIKERMNHYPPTEIEISMSAQDYPGLDDLRSAMVKFLDIQINRLEDAQEKLEKQVDETHQYLVDHEVLH